VRILQLGATEVIIKHEGTKKKFEHAEMRLCLHGERAEARKEQVKDVLVSNVRKHKEGEGEETNPCSEPRGRVSELTKN